MSLVEIIFRPISFFFLIPTIFLLMVLALNFWEPTPKLDNAFDVICNNEGQNLPVLSDYPVSAGTFLAQFIAPPGFTISDREFRYYEEAFKILEILYDDSAPRIIDFGNSRMLTRKNFG
ncbi:MAG: hypothetical protein PHG04_04390, partial [Candidatus Nanoarchaeia archaeon]|nr:hypothetical protein [Candidatus Nanoarchaeia archaeon]